MTEMLAPFLTLDGWIALATLAVLEVVLGIDNIIFLALVAHRVAPEQRKLARRIGLALALVLRIAFLSSVAWIIHLSQPVLTVMGMGFSWRDMVFVAGGIFLLTKSTREIHEMTEDYEAQEHRVRSSLAMAVVQIALFDIVFSIDSVVTAVGMVEYLQIMIVAVVFAMFVMLVAAGTVGEFVERHPTVKMLALSFLLLIGTALIADGLHFHIPRGYLYFAVAFSGMVEMLNQFVSHRRGRKKKEREPAIKRPPDGIPPLF
ncbi:MAG TPA: TerC family protein [Rhizomicrobium sp.]|jgi:predicted tellurium resistance membrane protein TerC|nr:TerC family protein [Rhizomicrobium sp.]